MNYAMLLARGRRAVATGGGGGGSEPPISGDGWDISTAVFSQSFSVSGQDSRPHAVFFKPDGLKMYVIGIDGSDVNEFSLGSAWDISTASFVQRFGLAPNDTLALGVFFRPDGLKMYVSASTGDDVGEYSLSVAWNIGTATYSQNFSVGSQEPIPRSVFFRPDGMKMYVTGPTNNKVNEYNLGSAWDISTTSFVQDFSVASQGTSATGVFFKPDGLRMYVSDSGAVNDVNEYNLGSAWDISTASYTRSFSTAQQGNVAAGIFLKPDGIKMYVVGYDTASIHEYNLSQA